MNYEVESLWRESGREIVSKRYRKKKGKRKKMKKKNVGAFIKRIIQRRVKEDCQDEKVKKRDKIEREEREKRQSAEKNRKRIKEKKRYRMR